MMKLTGSTCALLALLSGSSAASDGRHGFRVGDPMLGRQEADLNTVLWGWNGFPGCAPPAFSIDATGATLSGDLSTLGHERYWALRGDFRITVFVSISGGRVHFSLYEHPAEAPEAIFRSHGIASHANLGHTGVFTVFTGNAYFLIQKRGRMLRIHQGDERGVSRSSPVVASGDLGPDARGNLFTLFAQTGCPSEGGSIRLNDLRIEAADILPMGTGRPAAPAEWRACDSNGGDDLAESLTGSETDVPR